MTTDSGPAVATEETENTGRRGTGAGMREFTQRFHADEAEALRRVATERGVPVSEYVRRATVKALRADAEKLGIELDL